MDTDETGDKDQVSNNVVHLSSDDKARYAEKCGLIGTCDPYMLPPAAMVGIMECDSLPDIAFPEIYLYLISFPSIYTGESMKAYKSLDAYKYFTSGKVHEVHVWKHDNTKDKKNIYVFRSKVSHSMAIRDKPLSVWVGVHEDGTVITGHCDCMAGVSEVCSHVAATLFCIAKAAEMIPKSCTSVPCEWNKPSRKRQSLVTYSEGSEINFKRPKNPLTEDLVTTQPSASCGTASLTNQLKDYTSSQKEAFCEKLKNSGVKSALLALVPGFIDPYIPTPVAMQLPPPLPQLFNADYLKLSRNDLAKKCDEIFKSLEYQPEQVVALEKMTREQSRSNAWFQYRAGRITASNFKAAVSTDPAKPAVSLIKRICYPQAYKFSTEATRWGCQHEKIAIQSYKRIQLKDHGSLQVEDAGFHIHPLYSFLGASPDASISCECCGEGILEVKCPICVKDKTLAAEAEHQQSHHFCLEMRDNKLYLKENHAYYYQVQLQLACTNRKYCDFVVWRGTSKTTEELHIQRIFQNVTFIRNYVEKATIFFKNCILPELVGKMYTAVVAQNYTEVRSQQQLFCFCQKPEIPDMIMCTGNMCNFKKFHLKCLGLSRFPNTKQYLCPNCRKTDKAFKRKQAKELKSKS